MAKRTTTPPPAAAAPDTANEALLVLAETMLGEFFFDPDNEDVYKQVLSRNRPVGTAGVVLDEETAELEDGECTVQLEALRAHTRFRVVLTHSAFSATVEGTWSFDNEELRQTKFTRNGDPDDIEAAAEALLEAIDDRELDDEEFADFLSAVDDDEDVPMIGDDPTEPPEPTALDRSRLKAIAKRVARQRDNEISPEDRMWLEQTPQILPVITESLIDVAGAAKPDTALVTAHHLLLALALEYVRYRQDRGWEWADDMLTAFQQRLVEVAKVDAIPREDWFMMCSALTQARVPVADGVQTALADAGFKPEEALGPPEEMLQMVRHLMDELAHMVSSPFEVVEALKGSGAMLPAMLRSFMATELALSEHPVLREAVPLLLLDDESSVRVAAAGALEQIAHPETLSPDMLRRAITIRNWIPAADRATLDSAIRKARLAGVEIGAWPQAARDLELYASIVDGSGAQSILSASRTGKKGLFGGLLLRHGTGVMDAWADAQLSRGQIGKMLREAQMAAPTARVEMGFVDTVVQHAIGASVEHGGVPPAALLEIAELLGGTEWKDRRIDIKAEADRLFETLEPEDRSPRGVSAAFVRLSEWMAKEDVFGSWFEEGPQVQKALAKLPRTDMSGMVTVVMDDILPAQRTKWTERYLILALWCQAAADAKQRTRARDAVVVAHALAGEEGLDEIPAMGVIAMQTVRAVLMGGW
jgi:hypothetical protein